MVIMALDHTREIFHSGAFLYDPYDGEKAGLALFMTRWVTHFCAPTFSFLAGASVCFSERRKTKAELSAFLFQRGLWLVVMELTVISFAWCFDPEFRFISLATIWSLGISMILLAGLIHLPRRMIFLFGFVLVLGHNLFDGTHFGGYPFWAFLHDGAVYQIGSTHKVEILYPIIPWAGVMALGYCFGSLYTSTADKAFRKRLLHFTGCGAILLFAVLRAGNFYGDHYVWQQCITSAKTIMSILRVEKYPPSLQYLLITLGPSLLFLAHAENLKGRWVDFFSTFGKVPFFYYIAHLYLLHFGGLLAAQFTGFGWKRMILTTWVNDDPKLRGFGFGLSVVYLIWAGLIVLLYPLCKRFAEYKTRHPDQAWLSYM